MPSDVAPIISSPLGPVNLADVLNENAKYFNHEQKETKINTAVAGAMLATGGILLAGAAALGLSAATYFTSSPAICTAGIAAGATALAGFTFGRWGLQLNAETHTKKIKLVQMRQIADNPKVLQELIQGVTGDVEKDTAFVTDWAKKMAPQSSFDKPRCR
jgi:prolipoprotein diacylglyceryltransferase